VATYYPTADENLEEVVRSLLELADDPNDVVYLPGVGEQGAVQAPDQVIEQFAKVKTEHEAEAAKSTRKSSRSKADTKTESSTNEE